MHPSSGPTNLYSGVMRKTVPKLRPVKAGKSAPMLLRKGDSATSIYEIVRAKILSLELTPGSAIDEASIVKEYGVSRTPVREAIVRLASEGLVLLFPNRGSQVAPLDLEKIRDYLEAIDLCQRAVTAWAAVRRRPEHLAAIKDCALEFDRAIKAADVDGMVLSNRAFHVSIAAACGNAQIAMAYQRLLDEGLRIARFTLGDLYYRQTGTYRSFVDNVSREHAEMVDAIEAEDPRRAEVAAAAHTDHTRDRFVEFLSDTLSPMIKIQTPA